MYVFYVCLLVLRMYKLVMDNLQMHINCSDLVFRWTRMSYLSDYIIIRVSMLNYKIMAYILRSN